MGLSFGMLAVVVRSSSSGGSRMATTAKIPHFADISFIQHALMLVEPRSFLLAVVFLAVSFILGM
jgi:hypothetical protein